MTFIDKNFLADLVKRFNANVPSKAELRNRHKAYRKATHARAREIDAPRDADEEKLWARYAISEARYLGRLFFELAQTKRLRPEVIAELIETVKLGVRPVMKTSTAKPFIEFEPQFIATDSIPEEQSRAAYALLMLASGHSADVRVAACKHCGKLFVAKVGTQGKPRQFCSLKHTNAHGTATYRRLHPRSSARKHK
jgi:predicted RNA-binding Zn ribbon-like protein